MTMTRMLTGGLLTVNSISEMTGISRQVVAERLRGISPAGDARKGVPGWRIEDVLRPLIEAGDLQRERSRLAKTQADLADLELAKRRGELLPADDVARANEAVMLALRDAFRALPATIAEQLCECAAAHGPAGVHDLLLGRIDEVLTDAANAEIELID